MELKETVGSLEVFEGTHTNSHESVNEIQSPMEYLDNRELDFLRFSAARLQSMLEDGAISSVQIVKMYMRQIQKHNVRGRCLRAVISTTPEDQALKVAEKLDVERKTTGARGPMHGIPIIVKDTLCTPSLNMDTTCGSFALKGARVLKNAAVVDLLIQAGMIIIAKTNLSELSGMKDVLMTGGWSAVGGQTQSPYVRGGVIPNATCFGHSTPCGSSSGSAVGVAAGFAPVSIGTETGSSLVQPAARAALYAMKASTGSVSTEGIQPISPAFDSVGGMAKTTKDLADIMAILQPGRNYSTSLKPSWEGLKVGFVDPEGWKPSKLVVEVNDGFCRQTLTAMEQAVSSIKTAGARVVQPVKLTNIDETTDGGVEFIDDLMGIDTPLIPFAWWPLTLVLGHDLKPSLEAYLALFDNPKRVYTLKDLITFNQQHADVELPSEHSGQDILLEAMDSQMSDEAYTKCLEATRGGIRKAIRKILADNEVDVIMGPADGPLANIAAAAGYPNAAVPLGFAEFNGRAFGMNIIAGANQEGKILQVMSAWEGTFGPHRPPPMLLSGESSPVMLPL